MNTGFRKRRRGILAATSTLVVAAGIAAVSVAGAAQEVTVYSAETGGPCFTTTQNKPACDAGNDKNRPTQPAIPICSTVSKWWLMCPSVTQ